ncbi:DNA-binding protein [Pseudomonas capeferrum]|uniref:Zn-ribbon domain-containing OB-fold protein n=1 Tax=Pseudomonas capeferrum TaxID=1495066 RepID=UPI0015E29D35|nr:OB-fold domain-containing protein [Pseudomonas capeferrum]MBA1204236.1 DNA-binding protein [Pseudomonas capeferrum]
MSTVSNRTLPELNDLNRFFWTGGADGQLRFLRCGDCRFWLHPPGVVCPKCLSRNLAAEAVSGMGTIEALTVNHQRWSPDQEVPYVVAIVGLDEQQGLQLTTNIVGCPTDAAFIGQRVKVIFEAMEDVYLPLFTPA